MHEMGQIIESKNHRLEKTSRIIKSNCHPKTTISTEGDEGEQFG